MNSPLSELLLLSALLAALLSFIFGTKLAMLSGVFISRCSLASIKKGSEGAGRRQ
ncbi:hypothetical protein J7E38_10050 [Bacillus sp. ISL-35]|uniref:hypothetical protein n=1 Tax=Bacillus sp. ISL-35 TaxID=2819122 RepID=UPI001BECD471|nr:hypothetical protein [Bacillus sp. ISL-35]MBT2679345.1 hypothetical protein [Bacillus sp. ISL-35]MBT2703244.1 hypothetical protein [Chryseobacterium sp. ISL-80]